VHGIGGDFYDFVRLGPGRLGIAIGDVAGKGLGAALIMANLQASLRACLLRPEMAPPALVTCLNTLLYKSSFSHIFASLFYGEYDSASGELRYVNAGHNPPLIVRRGTGPARILRLEAENIPVGMVSHVEYEEVRSTLEPGDLLVAYTDGITDAVDRSGEPWGLRRLEKVVAESAGKNPPQIVTEVLRAREEFVGPVRTTDDVTLMVVLINPEKGAGSSDRICGSVCQGSESHESSEMGRGNVSPPRVS